MGFNNEDIEALE